MPPQSGLQRGDHIGPYSVTGRILAGPASDLVELDSDNGLRHTAVVFHPEYRGHPAIGDALSVVLGFLESPMVTGLVELVATDRELGAFVYPTGEAWSVAEVIRVLADFGEPAGVRAGLELMYAAGQILVEAADAGESQGVYSHGGLTPWRIMLKRDGQVLIIGHALPQVEILQFHDDSRRVPREDSFRYCPPERIEAAAEDLSSDLFSLALVAFELMTGKPVYDGLVNDIRQQAARAEGSRRLFRFREVLPQSVRDVLTYALRPDRADRYPTGEDFLESVRVVLSGPDATGPSLMDVMQRVSRAGKRTGTALEGGKTQMLSKDQLLAMLAEEDEGGGIRTSGDGVVGRSAARVWSPPPDRGRRRPRRSRLSTSRDEEAGRGGEAQPGDDAAGATPAAATPAAATPAAAVQETPSASTPPSSGPARGAARWSKVTRGPRASRVRRSGSGGQGDEQLAGPADVGAPSSASAAPSPTAPSAADPSPAVGASPLSSRDRRVSRSGDRARDLVAAIRASADQAPARARGEADDSSGSAAPGAPRPSASAAPRPRFEKGRARPSRRSRTSGDGPPPLPSIAERLAAARSTDTPPPPAVPGMDDPKATTPEPPPPVSRRPAAAPPPPDASVSPSPGRSPLVTVEVSETAPQRPSPRLREAAVPEETAPQPAPTPPARPPAEPAPEPRSWSSEPRSSSPEPRPSSGPPPEGRDGATDRRAGPTAAPSTGELAVDPLDRPPDPIAAPARGELVVVQLRTATDRRPLRLRLPSTMTTAEAIARLVGNVLPVRVDLRGGVTGWWRMSQDGEPVPATTTIGALSADRPVDLRCVPNRLVPAEVRVVGDEPPARFLAPVATAVPAVSLADHLAGWLRLPPGRWCLFWNGTELGPHEILADHPSSDPRPVIELRRPDR